jgi:hypothetical protein
VWCRLQLEMLSVRRFREEQEASERPARPAVRELLTAARRLNRALAHLTTEDVPVAEVPRLRRALRRTRRLVEQRLEALTNPPIPG